MTLPRKCVGKRLSYSPLFDMVETQRHRGRKEKNYRIGKMGKISKKNRN